MFILLQFIYEPITYLKTIIQILTTVGYIFTHTLDQPKYWTLNLPLISVILARLKLFEEYPAGNYVVALNGYVLWGTNRLMGAALQKLLHQNSPGGF